MFKFIFLPTKVLLLCLKDEELKVTKCKNKNIQIFILIIEAN